MSSVTPGSLSSRLCWVRATAISGVRYRPVTKRLDGSLLDGVVDARRCRCDYRGLRAADDGSRSYFRGRLFNDSVPIQTVATSLVRPAQSFALVLDLDLDLDGQVPPFSARDAAMVPPRTLPRTKRKARYVLTRADPHESPAAFAKKRRRCISERSGLCCHER